MCNHRLSRFTSTLTECSSEEGRLYCPGRFVKSLLVRHSTMRTGRCHSPRTLVSNFIWLSTMPGCWRHVVQRRMESLKVVMLHVVGADRVGL
jgi:hypothetical protein